MRICWRSFALLTALIAANGAVLIEAAPSVPELNGAPQAPARNKPSQTQLQACLTEATAADSAGRLAAQAPLSADAEATQLTEPDFAMAVRESQAAFHRCLQRQLNSL